VIAVSYNDLGMSFTARAPLEEPIMLLASNPNPVPDALDQFIFEAMVPADHYLRRVLAVVDFDRFRAELIDCYCSDQGRPAVDPVLLMKLEFLEYQYNLSDRQVVDQSLYNMAYRYFLGLGLYSPLPHHTLLTYFRERLGVERHQKLFAAIVAQGREHGLIKDRLRLKDATHVIANIAIPSAVQLVADTRRQLLAALRPYAPERVSQEEARAATIHTVTADLSGAERLLQRVTHLREIVAWVEALMERSGGVDEPAWWRLTEELQLAHKVLADREPKATNQLVSLQDPDARKGDHHGGYVGYLLDVSVDADSDFITALNVLPTSGTAEVEDATTLIRQEEQAHGNDVQALSIDGVGCQGEQLREWTDPQGLNLEVFVPPRKEPEPTGFTVDQFTVDPTGKKMTCPAGQTSQKRARNRHDTGWMFRFARKVCAACPLLNQCMAKLPQTIGRQVSTNDYAEEYAAARAKAQTPEYHEVRKKHWRVERKLSDLVRWHRGRRARYRGRNRVLIQGLLTGLVVNIKCLVRYLAPKVRAEVAAGC
jgi:transposase